MSDAPEGASSPVSSEVPSAEPAVRRGRLVAVLLAVVGGLVLVGATSADWVREETTRTVAGVPVPEVTTTSGASFAGAAIAAGLGALLGAVALAVAGGRARRVAALLVGAVGVAGAAVVGVGLVRALSAPGAVTAAPGVAALGALAVVAGAGSALRRPSAPPALDARYTVEGDPDDDEWRLASAEDED